jgi:signal transduction histidine kinase
MTVPPLVRRHVTLLLGIGVALVYVVEVLDKAERPMPLLATAPLIALVFVTRRSLPLLALAVCVGTFLLVDEVDQTFNEEGGLAWLVTWVTAHYALGRWTTGPVAWIAPVLAAGSGVALGWDDIGSSVDTGDLAYFLSMSLLPWGAGLVTKLRVQHVEELRAENERLEREQLEAARRAVIEERSRIARELHDVVSHAISVTVLQARGARRVLGQEGSAQVREALTAIEQTNTAALGDMRRLLAVLRDTEDDTVADGHEPQPSLARLDALVEQVRSAGLSVEVAVEGEQQAVPPGVDLSAYRIVQEALTNVLKHAGQVATSVRLAYRPTELLVSVENSEGDGGIGGGSGHGLIGVRERVAVIGGEVSIGPVDGGGYQLSARLPYSLELT